MLCMQPLRKTLEMINAKILPELKNKAVLPSLPLSANISSYLPAEQVLFYYLLFFFAFLWRAGANVRQARNASDARREGRVTRAPHSPRACLRLPEIRKKIKINSNSLVTLACEQAPSWGIGRNEKSASRAWARRFLSSPYTPLGSLSMFTG